MEKSSKKSSEKLNPEFHQNIHKDPAAGYYPELVQRSPNSQLSFGYILILYHHIYWSAKYSLLLGLKVKEELSLCLTN
jgi:hypothetical protein